MKISVLDHIHQKSYWALSGWFYIILIFRQNSKAEYKFLHWISISISIPEIAKQKEKSVNNPSTQPSGTWTAGLPFFGIALRKIWSLTPHLQNWSTPCHQPIQNSRKGSLSDLPLKHKTSNLCCWFGRCSSADILPTSQLVRDCLLALGHSKASFLPISGIYTFSEDHNSHLSD